MAIKNILRTVFSSKTKKAEDGRDQWPSRASFVLAAMGGCVGLGNILRYPSQVYNNFGLQWFIPYFVAFFFLGIPGLTLEIAIGQAYRGGPTIAFDHMQKRLKGIGFSLVYNGYMVALYYVPILAWAMAYFRHSFKSPLPWEGEAEDFYYDRVIRNPDPVAGVVDGGSVLSYTDYPFVGLVGETTGWCAFTWFLVWLCIWRGIGMTGRVVYVTMGLPILMILILVGRGVSLPNAGQGLRYMWATWRSDSLADAQIWQDACGQVFFSVGLGMGYYTTYASYNSKYQNALQDALIICFSNSLIEILCALAVFGVIGYLGMDPSTAESRLGSFDVAFLTLPEGLAQMPAAQFWSAVFFLTLMVLGVSSAFALTDTLISMICDSNFGRRWKREYVVTGVIIVSFLASMPFCTEFGYYLLDGFDTWLNNFSLVWVVMCEFLGATMIYRYKDVVGLLGWTSYAVYTVSYLLALTLGVAIGHSVDPGIGAGVGFGIFFVGLIAAVVLAQTPQFTGRDPPVFWAKSALLQKIYYLMFYQGCQLSFDLNIVVAAGNNWKIPIFWGPLLRYISVPILAIILGFSYPTFHSRRMDPLQTIGFFIANLTMLFVAIGFTFPRFFHPWVPVEKRGEGHIPFSPNVPTAVVDVSVGRVVEGGEMNRSGLGGSSDDYEVEPK
ncbi:putative sodium/chloride dependent neurotransmitter transporter [Periconia macrospinosa]|uniref:Putative sodium/chloride dependent neurotransmitter transporter n=1 Tax=Periconia macrospinosa TaxID=97972 RepID=A0A2V1EBQ0_9PLEO|nr:putative sodium/chloride dependent neurotransmitter transporter [Periconia macrospinosa]